MYMNDGNKTKINLRNKSVFITGVAGFIGSNLAKRLLSTVEGVKVVGLDNMNHYYDVRLKEARLNELEQFDNFSFVKGNLADKAVIESIFEQYKPEIVVNLGAQAGVRYSITNPDAYVEANLIHAGNDVRGLEVAIKNIINAAYSRDLSAKIAAADHVMQKKGMYLGGYRPFGFLPDPNDCHSKAAHRKKSSFPACEEGYG